MPQTHSVKTADAVDGQRAGFRGDIEGLRAVAVLAVVAFHAGVPGVGGGYVGVDVFFVISGFLITGLLWREATFTGTVRLRNFWGARARRLLPASALVGVVTLIAAVVLLPPLQAKTAVGDGIAAALYVGNYRFILQGVEYMAPFMPPSPFLHYWSLGVEEQFYLIWPAALIATAWLLRRRRSHRRAPRRPYLIVLAVIGAASLALSFVAMYWAPLVAFFSLPTRAWQLALGGLIALSADLWSRAAPALATVAGVSGLGLIIGTSVQLNQDTPYPGTAVLFPTIGAALVIAAGCARPGGGAGRMLGLAPMQVIGRISYSWYLWHWPVLLFAPILLGHPLGLAGRLTAALFSAGLAVLTLRYLENPVRFAPRVRDSVRVSLALGGAVTAMAVCVGVLLLAAVPAPVGRGAPGPALAFAVPAIPPGAEPDAYDAAVAQAFAEVRAAVSASVGTRAVPSNLVPALDDAEGEMKEVLRNGCLRTAWQADQPDCPAGDSGSAITVALAGDSHAAMWNAAFRPIAERRHWRLETLSKAACPLMDLPTLSPQLHREFTECERWRTAAIDRLRAQRPALVVLGLWRRYSTEPGRSAGFDGYDRAWIDSLGRLVSELRAGGAQVLVLGPIPDPGSVVPICLSGHLDDATACAPARSDAVNQAGITAERVATEAAGGQYADLTDLFCTARSCPVIVGDTLVYLDSNHLTVEYASALAPAVEALAGRALARSTDSRGH